MSLFRRLPTSRLLALCAAVVVAGAGLTAIALAASGGGPVPPPRPLANAIHRALAAPKVQGITARITFTNNLLQGLSLHGAGALLSGGSGRLWLGDDGRFRVELPSDRGYAEIVSDGKTVTVDDGSSNTAYVFNLPKDRHAGAAKTEKHHSPPTIADIQRGIARFTQHADIASYTPTDVGGQPAYDVRVSPKHDGGLIGSLELAWDANRGVPLRIAVYAQGSGTPVLELEATDISYGPVPASTFKVAAPKGTKIVHVSTPAGGARTHGKHEHGPKVTGVAAVQSHLPFQLAAPAQLVGLPRRSVELLDSHSSPGAVVMYGQGLGGMLVLEQKSKPGDLPNQTDHSHDGERVNLPTVSIGGATGVELATPLGTGIRFVRGGVTYTVLGSVPAAAAEAAARAL